MLGSIIKNNWCLSKYKDDKILFINLVEIYLLNKSNIIFV